VRVERSLDPGLPPIQGDPHELQQALLNLVTNAQHAVRAGEGGTVVIRTEAAGGGCVALEVEDNGPGVPEAIRSRIFDPFFTTKAAGQGTGLGLSIVYGIVRAHGGTIRVEDRSCGGARFRIELPIGSCVPGGAREPEAGVASLEPRRGRILVVDDEEPVARLICEALAEDGHDAVFAFGGREALDRMAVEPFDLIISDLRMPGLAAERLCEEMDRLETGLSRRLLLTTGDTVSREAAAIAERAGLALLHKPFDLDHLRRTVRLRLAEHPGRGPCAS
jgi:two-component system NtrC family sensor kinase